MNSQNYNHLFKKILDPPLRSYRRFVKVVIRIIILALLLVLFGGVGVFMLVFANDQVERRRSPWGAASLMPREVLQQAEKFSIVLRLLKSVRGGPFDF